MRPFALTCCIAGLWISAIGLAHSASDTLDLGSVRPGMKGYGLTVFRGTRPERFDVEVIDVLHDFQPDQDLILARTAHPLLEKAIVVGGMSGSPIYLDGKLAGAYAYGWPFGAEPVVGITPIANMLAEINRRTDRQVWRAIGASPHALNAPVGRRAGRSAAALVGRNASGGASRLAGLPPYLGGGAVDAFEPLRQYARLHPQPAMQSQQRGPQPALTPLMVSGVPASVMQLLDQELNRLGVVGLQAGSSGRAAGAETPRLTRYEDGGALGVQLLRGDISMTGIGTVTHVRGDRLIAFGHPMLNSGQPGFPTCTARVLHILASQQRSFKIAEADTPLGTMVHDRQSAVVIDSSLAADTVPLSLRVRGLPEQQRSEWKVEVTNHRMFTPLFAFTALSSAFSASAVDQTDVTFSAHSKVTIEGHGTISTSDAGYTNAGMASPLALTQLRMFPVLEAAFGNPFQNARVERIEVDLEMRFARDVVTIVAALVPSSEVDPGRDVNVYVTLKPFGRADEVRRVPVHVPASAAGQKIEIGFEPGNRVQLERPEPDDLAQLLENVRMGYPATSLVASIKLPAQGLTLRGQVVSGLPPSALDSLQLSSDSLRPPQFSTHIRTEVPLGQIVDGSARISLDVRSQPLR